jgi:hypothetical protein
MACRLSKANDKVMLLLRADQRGTQLRCVYCDRLLWTQVLTCRAADADAQQALDDSRAAWEAKGWRCECVGRHHPTAGAK